MSTIHTVQQGENLSIIARKYKIANWKDIYLHPDNAAFRKKRPNPNIIQPGDKIQIPELQQRGFTIRTGRSHVFVVSGSGQVFRLQLMDNERNVMANTRVDVDLASVKSPLYTNNKGIIEIPIPQDAPPSFNLDIYTDKTATEPSWEYEVQLSVLDPVDTVTGVQARLNALGFPAGPVDGMMGKKTRAGIKSFQRTQTGMAVDGELTPAFYDALEKSYGH